MGKPGEAGLSVPRQVREWAVELQLPLEKENPAW